VTDLECSASRRRNGSSPPHRGVSNTVTLGLYFPVGSRRLTLEYPSTLELLSQLSISQGEFIIRGRCLVSLPELRRELGPLPLN
jgi:hypothetical protein